MGRAGVTPVGLCGQSRHQVWGVCDSGEFHNVRLFQEYRFCGIWSVYYTLGVRIRNHNCVDTI